MTFEPVFKWPGSKRWMEGLAREISLQVGGRIVEPFAGSASFFVSSCAKSALLADVNEDLVGCLVGLRDCPDEVLYRLKSLKNELSFFEKIKSIKFVEPADQAARLIFLLNTCWGGVYRENKKGQFNVPFGNNGRVFFREDRVRKTSERLQGAEIKCQNYSVTLDEVVDGDLIFLDSPYVIPEANHFDRYNKNKFTWGDQVALSERFRSIKFRHARVVMAVAESESIYSIFKNWGVVRVQRRASLTAASGYTGYRAECLLFSPSLTEALGVKGVTLNGFVEKALDSQVKRL